MASGLLKFSAEDSGWMQQALALARRGYGHVEPNPMVGCVLVAQGEKIGEGFHALFGGPHAERVAIANAHELGHASRLAGCIAYVTLEPCCHHGKTPPCTDALLEISVGRVVAAMLDPFVKVAGRGVDALRAAGVNVQVGLEEHAALALNAPYIKRIRCGRPWVIAKWAMSLDGKIATHTRHSQWISCAASRHRVHALRSQVDAILVGAETALADDPLLTARLDGEPCRRALRVVADSTLRIPPTSQLMRTAQQWKTLLWAGPLADPRQAERLRSLGCDVVICPAEDLAQRLDLLLQHLATEYQATNLLVEGGAKLLGSLLELRQIDQCEVFVAPKLLGGSAAPSPIAGLGLDRVDSGPTAYAVEICPVDNDVHIRCRLNWS